jgi:hypothetical protein
MPVIAALDPSDNHYTHAQIANGDLPTFAIISPVIQKSEVAACKNLGGFQKINAPISKGFISFRRVISNFHVEYCSYNNKQSQFIVTTFDNARLHPETAMRLKKISDDN